MEIPQAGIARQSPPLLISEADMATIEDLALRVEGSAPGVARLLLDELYRAAICPADGLPANVVGLGSEVTFRDDASGVTRTVRLVLPGDADIASGRISITTPVGAGLIGLTEGAEISWPCPDGRVRNLAVIAVRPGPGAEALSPPPAAPAGR
jgi:regulator of nucleoside diphosphate kinase